MTDIQKDSKTTILRQDAKGRVHTPPEQRNLILEEFDRSGLSAPKFAKLHGINYQTFAGWRKRRKGTLNKKSTQTSQKSAEFTFLELESVNPISSGSSALTIELKGGHKVIVSDDTQIGQVATLIHLLSSNHTNSHHA